MKQEIEEKKVALEKQEKQKASLMSLFNGLQEKNLEANRNHDLALQHEKDEKKKMSNNFKKRISDISVKLQEQYDDKERVKTKN